MDFATVLQNAKKGTLSIWREHQNYESDISIQSNKTTAPATESAGAIA